MCDAGPLSSNVWTNFLVSGWFVHYYFLSCYFFSYLPTVSFSLLLLSYYYPDWINGTITYFPNTCILTWPLLLSFLLLFSYLPIVSFFPVTLFILLPKWTVTFFLFLFSHLSTVTFFPVTFFLPETVTFFPVSFFPTCPLLLSFLLLFFLLIFFLPETVTFFPVTFFPVTFFPCTGWECPGTQWALGNNTDFKHNQWYPIMMLHTAPNHYLNQCWLIISGIL